MSIKQQIKPTNIKIDDHFWNTFGHSETEVSARWLILFMRARNHFFDQGWEPFSLKDLTAFYQFLRKAPQEDFWFNRLNSMYVIQKNGMVEVTDQFVKNIASNEKLISQEPLVLDHKYVVAYSTAVQ